MKIIDLSSPVSNNSPDEINKMEITYIDHTESARGMGHFAQFADLDRSALPDGKFAATEIITLSTHSGTHLDAPWHYGPTSGGKPAKTIDKIPLEWCYGDGVVLDLSYKRRGEGITKEDIEQSLSKINYTLKPFDIVLIRTDSSKHFNEPGYENMQPGMTREATLWLINQGVKVMGIDAWGWDRPIDVMAAEHKSGIKGKVFEAHFAGRGKEYCHIEKLANLDQIPEPYGFKVAVFPVKVENGSAGWTRAVAILEE